MRPTTKAAIQNAKTDMAALAAMANDLDAPRHVVVAEVNGRPIISIPQETSWSKLGDEFLEKPLRLVQQVTFTTSDSFVSYVNEFGQKDRTMIFAQREASRFLAVLDYHRGPDDPAFGAHKAWFTMKPTLDWQHWLGMHAKDSNQTVFARFIDEHKPNIDQPDAADFAAAIRAFEAKKAVTFKSHQRAEDGSVSFNYEEDVQGSSKNGTVKIPSKFLLVLKPFEGGKEYPVEALLRYRVAEGGALALRLELVRFEDVLDLAFGDAVAEVAEKTKGHARAVLHGNVTGS